EIETLPLFEVIAYTEDQVIDVIGSTNMGIKIEPRVVILPFTEHGNCVGDEVAEADLSVEPDRARLAVPKIAGVRGRVSPGKKHSWADADIWLELLPRVASENIESKGSDG